MAQRVNVKVINDQATIIVLAIIMLLIIVVVFIIRRRRKPETEEDTTTDADTSSSTSTSTNTSTDKINDVLQKTSTPSSYSYSERTNAINAYVDGKSAEGSMNNIIVLLANKAKIDESNGVGFSSKKNNSDYMAYLKSLRDFAEEKLSKTRYKSVILPVLNDLSRLKLYVLTYMNTGTLPY